MKTINLLDLGLMDYPDAMGIQRRIHRLRVESKILDTLILTQHKSVITLGKTADEKNILLSKEQLQERGVQVYPVDRGGDVTYHGPGQLVGYPILHLRENQMGVRDYLSKLLDVFVDLLEDKHGIRAHKEFGTHTGVWIDQRKITAIGIQVLSQVTLHGFAYNISTDLSHFQWIHPCGLLDRTATSLEKELGKEISFERETRSVVDSVSRRFDWKFREIELDALMGEE